MGFFGKLRFIDSLITGSLKKAQIGMAVPE